MRCIRSHISFFRLGLTPTLNIIMSRQRSSNNPVSYWVTAGKMGVYRNTELFKYQLKVFLRDLSLACYLLLCILLLLRILLKLTALEEWYMPMTRKYMLFWKWFWLHFYNYQTWEMYKWYEGLVFCEWLEIEWGQNWSNSCNLSFQKAISFTICKYCWCSRTASQKCTQSWCHLWKWS